MSFGNASDAETAQPAATAAGKTHHAGIIITLMLLFGLMYPGASDAETETYVPVKEYERLSEHLLESDYQAALEMTEGYIAEYPAEPFGYLLKAAVIQYAATDYEDYREEENFMRTLDEAQRTAETKRNAGDDDLWACYFIAAQAGLKGGWRVTNGDLLSGIMKGRSGAHGMRDIIDADSTFYDAYLMCGSYDFWRNRALSPVRWVPFVGGEVKNAFAAVKLAIDRGVLTGPLANTVLMEMLLAHDPSQAVSLGETLLKAHPDCRLFIWQLGEAYKKMERFDDARALFDELSGRYASDMIDDGSGQLRCWWKIAVLANDTGRNSECVEYLDKILAIAEIPSIATRQRERIEKAREMRDNMH